MEDKKEIIRREITGLSKVVIGCFIYALSVVLFIDPVKIIPGSVTGIGVVVKALTGFQIGKLNILINVPLVIIGLIVLGKRFLVYTGLTVLLSSVMMDGLAFLQPFTKDMLMASIFGGVFMGIGLGLILDAGGTTGGTTVVGRLISKKYPHIPMGNILLVGDFIIILVGSIFLRNWDLLLYSVVDLYICVVFINWTMYRFKVKSIEIINSNEAEKLVEELSAKDFCRVIQKDSSVLMVMNKKGDISKVQQVIKKVDEDAVCSALDIDYISGNWKENL